MSLLSGSTSTIIIIFRVSFLLNSSRSTLNNCSLNVLLIFINKKNQTKIIKSIVHVLYRQIVKFYGVQNPRGSSYGSLIKNGILSCTNNIHDYSRQFHCVTTLFSNKTRPRLLWPVLVVLMCMIRRVRKFSFSKNFLFSKFCFQWTAL